MRRRVAFSAAFSAVATPRARFIAALLLACAGIGHAQQRSPSVDAFAQAQALNAELLASPSATKTLEQWCGAHHLADDPHLTARFVPGAGQPATPEQRRRLDVDAR